MLSEFAEACGDESPKAPPKPQQRGTQHEKIQSAAGENSQTLIDSQPAGIEGKRHKRQEKAQGKQQIHGDGKPMPGLPQSSSKIIEHTQPDSRQHRPKQRHSLGAWGLDQRNSLWRKLPWVFALSS